MPERTTTRWHIPYPELPDGPPDIPDYFKRRALIFDGFAKIDHGALSGRPTSTPGVPGTTTRMYWTEGEADSPRLDVDNGTGWTKVGPYPADAANNVASLRTLGRSEGQAMPGDAGLFIHEARMANWNDHQTPPTGGVVIVGSVSVALAQGQTAKLLGARHKCTARQTSTSVFKVQTDAASLGTLVDVPGLTSVQPAVGPFTDSLASSPIDCPDRTEIALEIVTSGNTLGIKFGLLIEYRF